MVTVLTPQSFFDLSHLEHADVFEGVEFVWEALKRLPEYTLRYFGLTGEQLHQPLEQCQDLVLVSPTAVIEAGAQMFGPVIVGPHCHLAANSVLRGPVILSDQVYVGRYSEVKSSLLFDQAKVPHLSYVGDSIIGIDVNMGAGSVLSNLKLNWGEISIHVDGTDIPTGMQKLGAILGDGVQIGCNAVLQPGTLVGARTWVYPGACIRGYYPPDHIVKVRQATEIIAQQRARVPEATP